MPNAKLVLAAGAIGLLAGASLYHHRRVERTRRMPEATPEPLQTWEGEGGAVPVSSTATAQQVSPSSALQSAHSTGAEGLPSSLSPADEPPYEKGYAR